MLEELLLGSQAWEWYHFIKGTEKGALLIPSGEHGQKRVAHYVGVHDDHHDEKEYDSNSQRIDENLNLVKAEYLDGQPVPQDLLVKNNKG